MRITQLLILIIVIVLAALTVYAGSCTDSDNGPVNLKDVSAFLTVPGKTIDQFGSHADICVAREMSNKKSDAGPYLREFYCSGALSMHKDFKCKDFEFEDCVTDDKGSYCKSNKPVAKSAQTVVEKKVVADFYCGSKVMNRADAECYPPGKLCIKDKLAGQCSAVCKCMTVGKKSTEESIEKVKTEEVVKETVKTDSSKSEAFLEIKVPEQNGVSTTLPAKEDNVKTDDAPIKQTVTLKVISAIVGGVKDLWSKITGLF